jgi:uncharacterized UPF0160 family protein
MADQDGERLGDELRLAQAPARGLGGPSGPDLVAVTGVPDAVFCHTGRFIAVARSREGAVALLEQALRD